MTHSTHSGHLGHSIKDLSSIIGSKQPIVYPCGCVIKEDASSGVLRSIKKCTTHGAAARPDVSSLDYNYFNFKDDSGWSYFDPEGIPQNKGYIEQMVSVLKELGVVLRRQSDPAVALEIGCGLGQYIPWLLKLGYYYLAVEPSLYAARWVSNVFSVPVMNGRLEDKRGLLSTNSYDLVLTAHTLEHLEDSPEAVRTIFKLLKPGGRVIIHIPDDTDRFNPDHLWFYTEFSLATLLDMVGFSDIKVTTKHLSGHTREGFIYATAIKPENLEEQPSSEQA